MKSFNNAAGTTSTEFGIGVGTGSEVRQFLLTATATSANVATFIEGNGFDWASWDNNTIQFRSPTTDFLNAINTLGVGGTVTNLTNYGTALEYTSFTIVSSSVSNDGYADYLNLVVTDSVTAQQYIHTLDIADQAGSNNALDRNGESITVSGIEFYDAKVLAKNNAGEVVAKQLRGTINGTTVTRIEDVFQEDFAADVELTSTGTELTVNCIGTGNFTVYITMTKVAE